MLDVSRRAHYERSERVRCISLALLCFTMNFNKPSVVHAK